MDGQRPDEKWNVRTSPYFLSNYGKFLLIGGVPPSNGYLTLFFVLMVTTHSSFLLYTALLTMDDEFAIFIESVHFATLLLTCFTGITGFYFYKDNFLKFCFMQDQGIRDYGDTLDPETLTEIGVIEQEMLARKNFRSKFMSYGLTAATCMLAIARPIFEYSSGKYASASCTKGIIRKVPVASWFPIDGCKTYGHITATFAEYFFFVICPPQAIGSCVFFLRGCEQLCFEFSLLQISLKNITRRVEHLREKRGQSTTMEELLRDCLNRSVKHHQQIIECFDLINELYNWLLCSIILGGSIMICLSGFLFSSDSVDIGAKISSSFFLTLELFHILVYCWYGEEIQTVSGEVGHALYSGDWMGISLMIKNHLLLIQHKSIRPLKISASFFAEANLETYSNVLSSAYSYFNLLRASEDN